MCNFNDLVTLCSGHKTYIQTHNFPDPDAIASAFGLQRLLESFGISSELCYDGRIDKLSASKMINAFRIKMLPYEQLRPVLQKEDYIICVDTQKHAENVTDFVGDEVACIDHHPTFTPVEYRYQDIRMTGACSTLIAGYYEALGREPDSDVATALLYGLKMDTLQFTRGVTELDIRMFGFLFTYCDQEKLSCLEKNNMEFDDLKAYGAAIESIEIYDKTGFSCIPFSCPDALVASVSDFILSLIEVEVAVVFSYREDGIKLSVRSENPKIHVGNLLHDALSGIGSGGGHAIMGGGFIRKEQVSLLGRYPKDFIRHLFLKALKKATQPLQPGMGVWDRSDRTERQG